MRSLWKEILDWYCVYIFSLHVAYLSLENQFSECVIFCEINDFKKDVLNVIG